MDTARGPTSRLRTGTLRGRLTRSALFRQSIAANELENVTALHGDLRQCARCCRTAVWITLSATRRISTATQAQMRRPPKAHRKDRTRHLFGRGTGGCCRSCCIPRAKPRSYSGRNGCGCCSKALARAARTEKNAVRAPERAGGAKRRHGRVPKRRQCGRTCC